LSVARMHGYGTPSNASVADKGPAQSSRRFMNSPG